MKHAVMIMAHKNVDQIIRLIKSLSSDELHVFVHLDSKMDLSNSDISKIENCSENVFVLNERISGSLDTWSLIEIVMSLIHLTKETELSEKIHYSYYLLLSGQDYPIKGNQYILDFLNEQYPKPLIDCTPYDENNWVYHKFNTVKFLRIDRFINSKLKRGTLRKIIKIPFYFSAKCLSVIEEIMHKYFTRYRYDIYGGSAWWILPDKVIDFIIDEMKTDKINKLKRTITPEETFFQIMTMASPLSEMVIVNPKDMVAQNCMTYAYFSDVGKPFMGHAYIFTKDDFNKIKQYPHLFARKFDNEVDSEIFNLIDSYTQRNN